MNKYIEQLKQNQDKIEKYVNICGNKFVKVKFNEEKEIMEIYFVANIAQLDDYSIMGAIAASQKENYYGDYARVAYVDVSAKSFPTLVYFDLAGEELYESMHLLKEHMDEFLCAVSYDYKEDLQENMKQKLHNLNVAAHELSEELNKE